MFSCFFFLGLSSSSRRIFVFQGSPDSSYTHMKKTQSLLADKFSMAYKSLQSPPSPPFFFSFSWSLNSSWILARRVCWHRYFQQRAARGSRWAKYMSGWMCFEMTVSRCQETSESCTTLFLEPSVVVVVDVGCCRGRNRGYSCASTRSWIF